MSLDQLYLITIFESWSVILGLLSSHLRGLKCLLCSWWCHCVTCLTWPFWSLRSVLWFIVGYFLVARWRTIGYCELSLMPSVADKELLWSYDYYLILISCSWRIDVIIVAYHLRCFSVAGIGLRWFYYDSLICDLMSLG